MKRGARAKPETHWVVALAALLVVVTVWTYRDLRAHEFLLYDDNEYVVEHPVIRKGLTWEGLVYVFTKAHHATWHPLTGVSHLLDVSMFGLFAPAHLAVNLALHGANAVLMFLLWWQLLGSVVPSFWVAAAFAWHPLHVESVAWVAERKDVLSTFFALVAALAYVDFVRRGIRRAWVILLVAYVAALLAKPMVVTLPLLLLMLDAWPLGRVRLGESNAAEWVGLVREKRTLFTLAFLVGLATIAAQAARGAMEPLAASPLAFRIANACLAYVQYLRDAVWPVALAVFYPRQSLTIEQVVLPLALLAVVTGASWFYRARFPWLWVGWLWYLVGIAPVAGILQVGDQARADRFTYLPLTGIFVAVAWQVRMWVRGRRSLEIASVVAGVSLLAVWAVLTARQTQHWRNTETLFRHALQVTEKNHVAHANLGAYLLREGRTQEALAHLEQAIALRPHDPLARLNLGVAAANRGMWQEAVDHYRTLLAAHPRHVSANFNLALALIELGQHEAARQHLEAALREDPNHSKARVALGNLLLSQGDTQAAISAYRSALATDPNLLPAHAQLAIALERSGATDRALFHYREVTRLAPRDPRAWFNLAAALRDANQPERATEAFSQALAVAEQVGDVEVATRARAALQNK